MSCRVRLDLPCICVLLEVDRVLCVVRWSEATSKRHLWTARTPKLFSMPARTSPRLRLRPRLHPEEDARPANTENAPIYRTKRQAQSRPRRTCAESTRHRRRLILSHLNTTLRARADSSVSIVPRKAVGGKTTLGTGACRSTNRANLRTEQKKRAGRVVRDRLFFHPVGILPAFVSTWRDSCRAPTAIPG